MSTNENFFGGTGYGGGKYEEIQEEVIKIPINVLYDLHLPKSIEIVRVAPPIEPKFRGNDHDDKFVWLHVRTPFSPVLRQGDLISYDNYHRFLDRYQAFLKDEADKISAYKAIHQ